MKDIFLEIKKIRKIYEKDDFNVVVFGTSEYSKSIFYMLEAFNINVSYFSDNNDKKWNKYFCNRHIISPNEIKKINNPFVVIGTAFFEGIHAQMEDLGIKHIYAILDAAKYPVNDMLEERKELAQYFNEYESNISDKILVKTTDFIGDNVLRIGIFKALIEKFGKENVYFLVNNNGVDDLLKILTENIIVINRSEFISDKEYRLDLLKKINNMYFKNSISFYTKFAYVTMDLLNEYNVNIKTNYIDDNCSYSKYIVEESIEFLCKTYNLQKEVSFYPKNSMSDLLTDNGFVNEKLKQKYIVISMVASSPKRMYDSGKFSKVINHLLESNYNIVLLGKGENDEDYYEEVIKNIDMKSNNKIINLVSKLTLVESIQVIRNAEFFIGVDSGMSHIAYVLNKMAVVIYGCGDYGEFMHNDENIYYVINKLNCSGCHWYCSNINHNGKIKCIDDIKPKQIIDGIKFMESRL